MNHFTLPILGLLLATAISACSSGAADPASTTGTPPVTPTAATTASSDPTPSPSDAMAGHDMGSMAADGETVTVDIANFAFLPAELVVARGTEVIFTNSDSAPHTVTAGTDDAPLPELFDSGLLEQGESFSFVFDEPGEFVYFCDRHPPMTATVIVEP